MTSANLNFAGARDHLQFLWVPISKIVVYYLSVLHDLFEKFIKWHLSVANENRNTKIIMASNTQNIKNEKRWQQIFFMKLKIL